MYKMVVRNKVMRLNEKRKMGMKGNIKERRYERIY
jgi:hypothetical protein